MAKFQYQLEEDEDLPSEGSLDVERELAKMNEQEEDEDADMLEAELAAAEELNGRAATNGKGKGRGRAIITGDDGEADSDNFDDFEEVEPPRRADGQAPRVNGQNDEHAKVASLEKELSSPSSSFRLCPSAACTTTTKRKKRAEATDYTKGDWEWDKRMRKKMKQVWGIEHFRLCQEAVCNAVMDGRDVVVLMPTGGGKSLCYQLPAVLTPGQTTLVVSPLIALMTDQLLHLHEAGVEAVMINGSTSKADANAISRRLVGDSEEASRRGGKGPKLGEGNGESEEDIKLCYVTPEKLAKSKGFRATLQKMYDRGRLARIVIDEAHCCSQMGHDYRPDYRQLSMLKSLFRDVPIIALTATCPPHVLQDLLKILKLGPVTEPGNANETGTVYFTAPLYRPNLRYQVLPKPASAQGVIKTMAEWILQHWPGKQGIIYTLSQKDTSTVAEGLRKASKGRIKTGIYHAGLRDDEKERIHIQWRGGAINTVCATIAFGMGIDAPSVRFVLHHTPSKSLSGYYQESGRAGRDGAVSDCVIFWRVQDASRLSGMVVGDTDGLQQLYSMVEYTTDLQECRKLAFHRYFTSSRIASVNSFVSDGADDPCGTCDNCTRPGDQVAFKDLGPEVWKILKVTKEVQDNDGRVTLAQLADLCRGTGGSSFNVAGGKGRGPATKISLNLETIAGGKVKIPKEDMETILMRLALLGYLKEDFVSTAYAVNSYLTPGRNAIRYTRLSKQQVDAGQAPEIKIALLARTGRKSSAGTPKGNAKPAKAKKATKASRREPSSDEEVDFGAALDAIDTDEDEDEDGAFGAIWEKVAGPSNGGARQLGSANAARHHPQMDLVDLRRNAAGAALKRAAMDGQSNGAEKKARIEVVELDD